MGNGGAGGDIGGTVTAGGIGGDWGVAGVAAVGGSAGGAAGSGIIDSGGTVVLFGSNATRYINGNGDH